MKATEHYDYEEFACKCCRQIKDKKKIFQLAEMLEKLRLLWNKPIQVISGYRCEKHNNKVSGAKKSQHLISTAADIIIKGVSPEEVAKAAKDLGFKGVGTYKIFTHVDLREGRRATWRG